MALFSKKQSDIPRRRRVELSKKNADDTLGTNEDRYAFRRNRTLTGSASSRVSALSESSAHLKSSRVQVHELVKKRRHIGGMLVVAVGMCLILSGLIWQFTAGAVVRAQDIKTDLTPNYEQIIQSYYSAQPIERFRFLLNSDHLNEYIQSKAPEIEHIEAVEAAGFGNTLFDVVMRKPIAGWNINSSQQYVDSAGTAFERNYYSTPAVQVVDKSGIQVKTGQAVASNRFLGFVGRAVGLSKKYGYKVTQVIIPSGATREIQLKIDGVGYPVKLSADRPAGEQAEDMRRAIKWLRSQNKTPKYLDVRVSGKAFYR